MKEKKMKEVIVTQITTTIPKESKAILAYIAGNEETRFTMSSGLVLKPLFLI